MRLWIVVYKRSMRAKKWHIDLRFIATTFLEAYNMGRDWWGSKGYNVPFKAIPFDSDLDAQVD